MKNKSTYEDDNTTELLSSGRFAYRSLSSALHTAITRLHERHEDIVGVQCREAVVKSHAHFMQYLIDIEADLAKNSKTVLSANSGNTLDLDAARHEIRGRLAKLAKR